LHRELLFLIGDGSAAKIAVPDKDHASAIFVLAATVAFVRVIGFQVIAFASTTVASM